MDRKTLDLTVQCTEKILDLKQLADESETQTLNFSEVFSLLYDLSYEIEKATEHKEPKETDSDDYGLDRPICPHCNTKIYPVHFNGYYDSFDCWMCECTNIPTKKKVQERGQYA